MDGDRSEKKIRIIYVAMPVTLESFIPYIFLISIYSLFIYTVFYLIKKRSEKLYKIVTTAIVHLFPFFLIKRGYTSWYLISMVLLEVCATIYCYRKIMWYPRDSNTYDIIYRIFKFLFTVNNISIIGCGLWLSFSFYFLNSHVLSAVLFFGLSIYCGVISRELSVLLGILIGMKGEKYFLKEKGVIPNNQHDTVNCMICQGNLVCAHGSEENNHTEDRRLITLSCGHTYHRKCILVLTLVCKYQGCPYCGMFIEIREQLNLDTMWDKTEIYIKPIMNFVKGIITYWIGIYVYIHYIKV